MCKITKKANIVVKWDNHVYGGYTCGVIHGECHIHMYVEYHTLICQNL